jgi:hypothetical protein
MSIGYAIRSKYPGSVEGTKNGAAQGSLLILAMILSASVMCWPPKGWRFVVISPQNPNPLGKNIYRRLLFQSASGPSPFSTQLYTFKLQIESSLDHDSQ